MAGEHAGGWPRPRNPDVETGSTTRRRRLRLWHDVHELGVDRSQGVEAASAELPGDGDRRDLAVVSSLDLRVVVVAGAAVMTCVLGRLVERPAQDLRSLPGQMPARPSSIGLIH